MEELLGGSGHFEGNTHSGPDTEDSAPRIPQGASTTGSSFEQ